MSGDPFENTSEKYKSFSEYEWSLKTAFSYDDHKGFSDLKILKMQNKQRFSEMEDMYGLPWIDFCNDYNFNNKRNRLLQRHLCTKKCFWNP